ncbi:MAG: restriction endonuclease subunit S [Acidimicrobiia bacterium]|nr:restriction endonuclease subunit S [Acidimicrobiia bacterium]
MTALSELCTSVDYGYTASASDDPSAGPKFLRITDIVPDSINWGAVPHCEIEDRKLEKFLLNEGDIVVARTGATVGYAKQIWARPESATFASYLVRFRPDAAKVNPYYLGQIIQSAAFKKWVKSVAGGAAQPNANARLLGSYEVVLPDLDIQRSVVRAVMILESLMENNRRRIEILEEMTRLLYREWFVYFRFPGHEDVELVDSDLGPVPDGWNVSPLVEACSLVMGQSPKSEYYNDFGEGLPFHQGVTDFGPRFPTHTKWTTVDKRVAEQGDILFSVRAPVGRINVASDRLVVGRGLSAIRALDGNQNFLLTQLKDKFAVEDSIGGGTIFNAVTKKDMESIQLLKPIRPIVEAFEDVASPMADLVATLSRQNLILREARDLLLPRLVSDELDVTELDLNLEAVGA